MSLLFNSLLLSLAFASAHAEISKDYCIIGAGPSGLQMGYFLHRANRDYLIIERNSVAGSFFLHYPRHRTLISINKRHTGTTNKEFNFRHDWNSLISDDESLMMKHYSKDYLPPADTYVAYLRDYAEKLSLNIRYNSEIVSVERPGTLPGESSTGKFLLTDANGTAYHCGVLVMSTGMWIPNIPTDFPGIEYAEGYENVSINPDDFEGQTVLILGRGNSGFETASHIVGSTAYIHMTSRSRIKLAYQTHYVGDLRAINDALIDTYQLKSLDGLFESELGLKDQKIVKTGNKLYLQFSKDIPEESIHQLPDNLGFRSYYDRIIRCMGFKFDFSIFKDATVPDLSPVGNYDKYPFIHPNYESTSTNDMFFTGVATHSLDYRKSAGGFIHGFRYTTQSLFRHLEWRYHSVPWPSITLHPVDLTSHFVKRMNEASGIYQMFGVLADVAIIREDNMVDYLEEVPVASLHMLKNMTGHEANRLIILNMQYGPDYSGPGKDVLREDRAIGDPQIADKSNFLHPVLYYYDHPIEFISVEDIPYTDRYHHVIEDFLTDWTARRAHIIPLRRFIESVFDADLRCPSIEDCFTMTFVHGANLPACCKDYYLKDGQGVGTSQFNIQSEEPTATSQRDEL